MAVDNVHRMTSFQKDAFEIVQIEAERRRNGGKGFSLTVNQMLLEWVEYFNVYGPPPPQSNPHQAVNLIPAALPGN